MDCSVVIVSYNTFDLTREAIRTALLAGDGLDLEVIVVDNHSPDGSGERLRAAFPEAEYPHVQVIANRENRGFSGANNQGARRARGRVLYFLNPDTRSHPHSISRLHDFLLDHPDAGAAGPHVLNPDGTDQRSTGRFSTGRSILRHHLPLGALFDRRLRSDPGVPERTVPVDLVKGCALAVRRDAFDAVGGWDESYFMYSEERELCYALQQAGYVNYFVREAVITHYGGASTEQFYAEQQIVQQRSALQFLRRHHGPALAWLNRITGIVGFSGRAVAFALMARLRPNQAEDYRRRGAAASALWRWFLNDYS